jgi:predicted AlkP superfamily pyrophosphatase or phosphodiesterase
MMQTGCATREALAQTYDDSVLVKPEESRKTVVLIVVDGLSQQTLTAASPGLVNLNSFFRLPDGAFTAHAGFPSLTFPGISSLLKEQPVSETGFLGNTFYLNGEFFEFEKPLERERYSQLMHGHTIFSRLTARSANSVSLDYGLGSDATVETPLEDLSTLSELADSNYLYADTKKIDSLVALLESTSVARWPSFIFLHLVGVDFLSHDFGSLSAQALSHLKSLDEALGPVFEILKNGERSHGVVTMLTADHGFASSTHAYFPLNDFVKKISTRMIVINESRMASILLNGSKNKEDLVSSLLNQKGIEQVAEKTRTGFLVRTASGETEAVLERAPACPFEPYAVTVNHKNSFCLTELSESEKSDKNPYLFANLARYFLAKNAPDIVVIPDRETLLSTAYVGNHGGPSPEETIVPLLLRNASSSRLQAVPLWRLLDIIK